jgi:hypothetical protein
MRSIFLRAPLLKGIGHCFRSSRSITNETAITAWSGPSDFCAARYISLARRGRSTHEKARAITLIGGATAESICTQLASAEPN